MLKNLLALIIFLLGINEVKSQENQSIQLGSKHSFHSEILEEKREYWVSFPESYSDEESNYKKYPILIVLDRSSFFHAISSTVNYMGRIGRVPEMIVVGIQNVSRTRDFTPDKIVTARENDFGGGDDFLDFLEKELIPKLDQEYKTAPYRILFGHSLGGLLATHAYMKENTIFNSFLAIDPSFGSWDAPTMDKKLEAVTPNSFDRYLYLATANWGKRNIRNRDRHVRLYEALNSKVAGEFPATLEYFENEDHSSVPIPAFHHGLSSIFEGYGISYRDVESLDQLTEHFEEISQRLSWSFDPPENLVNRIGYSKLQSRVEEEKSKALAFFLLNTENYPGSYNAFDSLGEAYEELGNVALAIENYEKSLRLNPNNEHARMRIESLKKNQ
ncbi:tetratricopeptide repeat protein [Algoriphagus aestuarii]|nr:tetratricopeptide repeat protein [Algoriphagus aestuarii]